MGENEMILDAATTSKMIRYTISTLKSKNAMYRHEPARSILLAFEELATSFDLLRTEKVDPKIHDDETVASLKREADEKTAKESAQEKTVEQHDQS